MYNFDPDSERASISVTESVLVRSMTSLSQFWLALPLPEEKSKSDDYKSIPYCNEIIEKNMNEDGFRRKVFKSELQFLKSMGYEIGPPPEQLSQMFS